MIEKQQPQSSQTEIIGRTIIRLGLVFFLATFGLFVYKIIFWLKYGVWLSLPLADEIPYSIFLAIYYGIKWEGVRLICLYILRRDVITFLILFGCFLVVLGGLIVISSIDE